MAAEYTYLFADLLTNSVNLEVPVYGVSFNRKLNSAGDCTLSINLDRTGFNNADVLGSTVPGKTALYIDRNGQLVWGGVLWSRTYQSQAKVISFTGQTFESYLDKIVIESTIAFTDVDQRNILNQLIIHMQQKVSANINIVTDPYYPFSSGGILRSTTFYDYDTYTYGKAIEELIRYDLGFDFTIEPFYDSNGNPSKRVRTDNILGASVDNTGLVFEYPGSIENYYWPENASRAAVSVIGVGAGEGTDRLRTRFSSAALLAAGYPDLQNVYSNTDVSIKATLDSQAQADLTLRRIPITIPTLEVNPTAEPQFGSWSLGDYAKLEIVDPRFPDGSFTSVRIVGYDASPPTSEGSEKCKLIIAGDEDA